MQAEWRVAAILNESLADTMRFAAWYLAEGAHSLLLFFDNPRDPAIGILGDHPRIECVPCTPAFWESIGIRPDARFVKRQNAALTHAYRNTDEPWFLNVDADEFLHVRGAVHWRLSRRSGRRHRGCARGNGRGSRRAKPCAGAVPPADAARCGQAGLPR
ncbi:glycosyltransferase family 2 protein [Jhaorihella thermophila]